MSRFLRVSVSAALLGWLAWQTDWTRIGDAFTRLRLELWFAAVFVLLAAQVASAVRWHVLAGALGLERSAGYMVGIYFVGMFFNLLLPTSVGGDVVRTGYLDAHSGNRLGAFTSVLLDRLCGLWLLLALACAGLLLSPLALPSWIAASVWGCALAGVAGSTWLLWLGHRAGPARGRLRRLAQALRLVTSRRTWIVAVLLSAVIQAANVAFVWLLGLAIAAPVPASYYWVLVPLVSLLTLLPLSVNGMGVREKAMSLLLAPLGIASETAVTLALLWFAVSAAVSLLGGLVYWFGRLPRWRALTTPEEVMSNVGPIHCNTHQRRARQSQTAA